MKPIVKYSNFKMFLYMFLLTLIIGLLGSYLSTAFNWGLSGTGMFLIIAGIINYVAYFFSDRIVIWSTGAKKLDRETAPELFELVENLSQKAALPTPKLYIMNTHAMNAFATGRNRENGVVVVTKGLVENLRKAELEGVLAHELSHIGNLDIRLMAVVSVLVGLVSILADTIWYSRIYSKASQKDQSGVLSFVGLVLVVISPIIALMIKLAISRKQEFKADAKAAQICGSAAGLISALKKISRDNIRIPTKSYATAHLYFSNPFDEDGLIDRFFSTHPPISERINRLSQLNY